MNKKTTTEELIRENEKLIIAKQAGQNKDERIRKEFAKAFAWNKQKELYSGGMDEPATPTWEQIFIEVGKLLAARTFYDLEGNVSELECKLEDLENKIRKEIHPNQ